jgi:hypothetical protein
MQITYVAQRSLNTNDSPIHVAGTEYTISLSLKTYDRKSKTMKKTVKSIGGFEQTTYLNQDVSYRCMSEPLTGTDVDDMREFLDSVMEGASFSFNDQYSSPEVFQTVYIIGASYGERRAVKKGGGGDSDYFTFNWSQRVS